MEFTVDVAERLDKFLARRLPQFSRSKLTKVIDAGGVVVDGRPEKASYHLAVGMVVSLGEPPQAQSHDLTPAEIELDIVYEDEDLLVVNKPRGLAAHPAASLKEPSLVNALLARRHGLSELAGSFRPGIVHRLDKDTTGLMIVAKNDEAHAALAHEIETKAAERRYVAVVAGDLDQDRFDVNAPIGRDRRDRLKMGVVTSGKAAISHFKRIARLDSGTLVAVRLDTGRTHQIRVHASAIGHPVLGDKLYAPRELRLWPLQLHAAFLSFRHPRTRQIIQAYAAPDYDFLGRELVSLGVLEPF